MFFHKSPDTTHFCGFFTVYHKYRGCVRDFSRIKKKIGNCWKLHLKECEFRCNMRSEDMYEKLLEILRNHAKIQPERISRITKNQLLKLS
jgi:hypothetical protein